MGVTLPYTITNGTSHDAVPVQRNFEALRDGHNTHAHDGVDTPKVNFANIDGKPVAYPPSAHKTSHASGGADAITPTDIGAVPASDVVTTPTAGKILRLDANAKLPASITGDAETVDGAHAGTGANNVLKLDASGKVPASVLPGAGQFYFAGDAPYSGTRIARGQLNTDYGSWLTVGPTGSGASVIWTALDSVPTEARGVRLNLAVFLTKSAGASSSPNLSATVRKVGASVTVYPAVSCNADLANEYQSSYNTVDVQLDATRKFEFRWDIVNLASASYVFVAIYLEGWYA